MLDVPGGFGCGCAELLADLADLGELAGEQARDLRLERAGVDDLAERGVGREREKVASDVEGSGLQGSDVGVVLHRFGARNGGLEGFEHSGADAVVGGEHGLDRGGEGWCLLAEVRV